jgi:hypothetical protein
MEGLKTKKRQQAAAPIVLPGMNVTTFRSESQGLFETFLDEHHSCLILGSVLRERLGSIGSAEVVEWVG